MISIATYSKAKNSGSGSGNGGSGGGGFSNTTINYKGIEPHYLWGNYFDGTQDISGNIDLSKGKITAKEGKFQELEANVFHMLTAYTDFIHALEIEDEGDLSVSGNTSLKNTDIDGTLDVSEDLTVGDDIIAGGGGQFGGDLDVHGNGAVGGTFEVSGATTLRDDLGVGGDSTFAQDVTIHGDTHATDIYSENITNTEMIKTKDLEVTGRAHFFELVIDKIKAAGGAVLLTPADGFRVDLVEPVENGYNLYFRSDDENGNGIFNMWEVGDQAICQSFNQAKVGVSYDVSNKFYWCLVTGKDEEEPVEKTVSGVTHDYHYITISTQQGVDETGEPYYYGTVDPEVGDEVAMLGYRGTDDDQRQCALYLAAYQSIDLGLTAPLFAEYRGINNFDLASHRASYIDANRASFIGELRVENGDTVENVVNSATTEVRNEFQFGLDGLTSKVSKLSRPNILPANDWKDADNKPVYQEDDEEYTIPESASTLSAAPPVIYLDKGDYTMSVYAPAKFLPIAYGLEKDNLSETIDVSTMIKPNDTWHDKKRSLIVFHAPVDGYYHLGLQMMSDSYSGDTPYQEYEEPYTPGSGITPTSGTIQTEVTYALPYNELPKGKQYAGTTSIYPPNYGGSRVYQSSNPAVAVVDQYGNVRTVGDGNTTINVYIADSFYDGKHYKGSSSSYNITVRSVFNTSVSFVNPIDEIRQGSTHQTYITVTPELYAGNITYSSSNPTIAAIDENGNITTNHDHFGNTVITVTAHGYEDGESEFLTSSDSFALSVLEYADFCDLIQDDGNVIELRGEGQVTREMVSAYTNSTVAVQLGHKCTSVGVSAFEGFSSMSAVTMENTITSIEYDAFSDTPSLQDFYMPDSVRSTGGCILLRSGIKTLRISENLQTIGGYEFGFTNITHVTIPNNVRQIFRCAFNNTKLTSVQFGSESVLEAIYDNAFSETSLSAITIPSSVKTIKDYAFASTPNLKHIDIPNTLTEVGGSMVINSGIETANVYLNGRLPTYTFKDCQKLKTVTFSDSATEIGIEAFMGCTSLENINFGGVSRIDDRAFKNCTSLKGVNFTSGITTIDAGVFEGCTALEEVDLPDTILNLNVTYANGIFKNCTSLSAVTFGTGITTIPRYLFDGCSSMKLITAKSTIAPDIDEGLAFINIGKNGVLRVPAGSTGYDEDWMSGWLKLGYYNWTKEEY